MRFSIKTVMFVILICALLVWLWNYSDEMISDGYAQYIVGVMIVDFMEENNGKWPRDWDSLKPHFDAWNSRRKYESLKSRIFVDFNVDVNDLRNLARLNERAAFRIVYAKYTTGFYALGDANDLISNYLRKANVEEPSIETCKLESEVKEDTPKPPSEK